MTQHLIPLIPDHRQYVEVFGGGASLLFSKTPSESEIYNDLDIGLTSFFRILRDPEKFWRFYYKINMVFLNHQEWQDALETWEKDPDEIERAVKWFIVARQSFGGMFGRSFSVDHIGQMPNTWQSILMLLPLIHERFKTVNIENRDWRGILDLYNFEWTFAYLDPPYIHSTRSSNNDYQHEMTEEDHIELVQKILEYPGMIMLSGYEHEIYDPLGEAGWRKHTFDVPCSVVAKTRATGLRGPGALLNNQMRTECVWLNPAAQNERRQGSLF